LVLDTVAAPLRLSDGFIVLVAKGWSDSPWLMVS
jgi:hypothetical protein